MGRRYQYNMTAEHLKELYDTEMPEEAKHIWSEFLDWLISYFHCSKQLADIRLREFSHEYNIHPMKTVGLTSINRSSKCPEVPGKTSNRKHGTKCFRRDHYIGDNMTDLELDIADIKLTLKMMKEHIKTLETKLNRISPQYFTYDTPIYTMDMPLSLSAAKSMWPMLENEFDEYCAKHGVTAWTPTDSENFYNEYVGVGADWPSDNDTQKG